MKKVHGIHLKETIKNNMSIKAYSIKEKDKWNDIVESFKKYDIYYLSDYCIPFYLHGDGEPLLFFYEDNELRAINVVMKRDISNDKRFSNLEKGRYFDFSTPYGYGGWLIEGDGDIENIFKEYITWCKNNNIISEVVRFHPVLNNQNKVNSIYDVVDLGKTVCIDLSNENDVWDNFSSKNRNVIRKAIKNNIKISYDLSSKSIDIFKNIYNQTMNRDNADEYYYFNDEFYSSILEHLNGRVLIFNATLENKTIASSMIIFSNDMLSYHLSGSLKEYGSLAATNLLLFEVSKWGIKNGYKTFHLGGGVGSKEDSLYSFKKAFNKKDDKQYSIGRLIFDDEAYNYLVSLRKDGQLRDNYFPLYRA